MKLVKCLVLVLSLVTAVSACDRRSSSPLPSSPTPVPPVTPQPTPAPTLLPVSGYVYDTAFRPVDGAKISVVDGPKAGTETMSTANGYFAYEGQFAFPVTLRATKEGYIAVTASPRLLQDGRTYTSLVMASVVPPVSVAGNYTLTIRADSTCAALPDEVRTRSYAATVTVGSRAAPANNTLFNGFVTGAQFAPFSNTFWIGVFGNYLAISTEGEGPSLVEQVGPNRYVAFFGEADVSVEPTATSTLSAPFKGTIEYCELKSAIGQYYDCSPALAAVREVCTSDNGQLTLTRR